jgi:hypothetical protein
MEGTWANEAVLLLKHTSSPTLTNFLPRSLSTGLTLVYSFLLTVTAFLGRLV